MADNWNSRILREKQDLVRRTIREVWSQYGAGKDTPQINFKGCPEEDSWNQLAHYHPNENKICVSERQLTVQNYDELKSTIVHEITHALGMSEHGPEFDRVKNDLSVKTWRPPPGPLFIHGGRRNTKAGTADEKRPHISKTHCNKNGCSKRIDGDCKYCGRGYCKEHLTARVVTSLGEVMSLKASDDYEKFIKYNADWQSKDGHSCPPYTDVWRDESRKTSSSGTGDWSAIKGWVAKGAAKVVQPSAAINAGKGTPVTVKMTKEELDNARTKGKSRKDGVDYYYRKPSDLRPVDAPEGKTRDKRKGAGVAIVALLAVVLIFAALMFLSNAKPNTVNAYNTTMSSSITITIQANISAQTVQQVDRFTVVEREYSMTPNVITVHSGDKVVLNVINNGTEGEDFFVEGVVVNLPVMSPGENDTISFNAPAQGNYSYFSSVRGHRNLGLVGTMEVLQPS